MNSRIQSSSTSSSSSSSSNKFSLGLNLLDEKPIFNISTPCRGTFTTMASSFESFQDLQEKQETTDSTNSSKKTSKWTYLFTNRQYRSCVAIHNQSYAWSWIVAFLIVLVVVIILISRLNNHSSSESINRFRFKM